MSNSEKNQKDKDAGIGVPPMPNIPDEQRKEQLAAGFGILLIALLLLFGAESEWTRIFGILFAGGGVALLGAPWLAFLVLTALFAVVVAALFALNGFAVNAAWREVVTLLITGGVVAQLSHFWVPACRKPIKSALDFALKRKFADEEERIFAITLVREFAPIVGFVLCVYSTFWFLGFLEEILTITILAAFAWCAKMEKHYGGEGISGSMITQGLVDPDNIANLDNALIIPGPFLVLMAFPNGTTKKNPSIGISMARYGCGPIYFVMRVYNFPSEFEKKEFFYKFMQMSRLIRHAQQLIAEERKYRSTSNCWHIDLDLWRVSGLSAWRVGATRLPARVHPAVFMILINFYFWFFIRYRYSFLGKIVQFIGESAGKILYMFYKSDADARKTGWH